MRIHRSLPLGILVTILSVSAVAAASRLPRGFPTVVRIESGTPGREVHFRGVLLVQGEPMRLVEQATPYEFRSDGRLVFGAFEPTVSAAMLRLELNSATPEPAVVTAPRVMLGQQIGGVATDFVQGY